MADLNISGDIQISPTSLTGSLHPTTINLSGDLDTGNGKDGYSPTVDVEVITGGHRITITDRDGAHTFDVVDGTVGVGISDISKTSTHDAEDTYTITYTDGSTTTFVVTNGEVTWSDVGNIAVVSHTQPSSSHNVIWIEDEGTTIELPTMDDLEEVADDVDDLKAEISQLSEDVTDELGHKVAKPLTNPNGTPGQLLRTNGNGTTIWVDEGLPTDAQTAQAVSDWLEDHPEATTTVEDGAITWAKLNSTVQDEIGGKAPAIIIDTDEAYSHSGLISPNKIRFNGNGYPFNAVRYADHVNLFPTRDVTIVGTNGVTNVHDGHFIKLDGTATSTKSATFIERSYYIPAGSYIMYFKVDFGTSVLMPDAQYVQIYAEYADGTSGTVANVYVYKTDKTVEKTIEKDISKLIIRMYTISGTVYNNYTIWYGMYDANTTIVDTGQTIEDGETYDFSSSTLLNMTAIDTMEHTSIIRCVADTKTYVDNLEIDIFAELPYASPELFGAVGDNNTDDTQAVQNCINYAITNHKAVRGYGRYKTTSPLIIDTSRIDVYFNTITYTGTDAAIVLNGKNNTIRFNDIVATTGKGISIQTPTSTDNSERAQIIGNRIYTSGHCVEMLADTSHWVLYVVIRVKTLSSTASDCVYADVYTEEIACYDVYFNCPNGWCFNGVNVHLINCTIEGNCNGGVYANACDIIGGRAGELMDRLMPGNPHFGESTGILFKAKSGYLRFGINIRLDGQVYYDAIDLSEVLVADTGDAYASVRNSPVGVVNCPIVYGDQNYKYGTMILGSKMILHGKDKICVPQFKLVYHVTRTDCDMRDKADVTEYGAGRVPFPTHFVIDVANCVIRLSPSYCSEGYSEFEVDMSDYMVTIYDRRGNLIFDPSGQTSGVYRFMAVVDPSVDTVYQKSTGTYSYPINSGYCDVWTVEKIS